MTDINDSLNQYAHMFSMSNVALERAQYAIERLTAISPKPAVELLITDTLDGNGVRSFLSLWIFSSQHCLEAHEFMTANTYDIATIANNVTQVYMSSSDFTPGQPSNSARLLVNFTTRFGVTGTLGATGHNCDLLYNTALHHLTPHLI